MFKVGDRVITVTDDGCDGLSGTVRELWFDGYSVVLDSDDCGYWFGFDEVRKVEA